MKLNRLIFALFIFLLPIDVPCQTGDDASTGLKIQEYIKSLHGQGLFNGSVLVSKQGQIIYKEAFGYAEKEDQRMLNTTTPFYLASVSKQFTTMCIMMLEEDGKLEYDDVLAKYFPKFPAYAKEVTIRQMMQHTSGVANHYSLGIYKPGLTNHDVLLAVLKQPTPDFAPGTKYSYSNGAYVLLAMIVEKISGLTFAQFVEENIFNPLNMNDSWVLDESSEIADHRAIGYTPFFTKDDYSIYTTGAGGIYSTVEDLFKWERALHSENLVSQASLRDAFSPAVLKDGSKTDYGFGWAIQEDEDGRVLVSHGGSLNGFRTRLVRDLDNENFIVLLTNHTNLITGQIADAIDQILLGNEPVDLTAEDQYSQYVSHPRVITDVLYAVISGDAGVKRDWTLFKYLFSPEARLIPVRKMEDGQVEAIFMTPDQYIEQSGPWLEENGFHEREIHRKTERFGNMMHVFSTYESFRTLSDKEPFARGINSIQLHYDGTRWWILNIYWNSETLDLPIPSEYLPSKG